MAGISLGACQTTNETIGTGAGGLIGGLIGAQFGSGTGQLLAAGIGAGAGALIGNRVAAYLDERDRQLAEASTIESYQTGSTQTWTNPDTGATGTVRPVGTTSGASTGSSCQLQEQTIRLNDGTEETTRYRMCERNGEFYTEPA